MIDSISKNCVDRIKKNTIRYFFTYIPTPVFLFFYSFTVAYVSFVYGLQGDTLFHIKIGEYISKFGIPKLDPFSWTTYGKPWFAHEWLWDLIISKLYYSLGYIGVFILHFISITLITFCIYALVKERLFPFLTFLFLVNTTLIRGFYSLRPQTLIYGFFALFLCAVSHRSKFKQITFSFYLFFFFTIWANMHSSVVLVLGFLFILTLFKTTTWIDFFCALAGSVLNPHGWRLFFFAIKLSNLTTTADRITEWFSPDFHYLPTLLVFLYILFCLVITAIHSVKEKKLYLNLVLFFVTIALFLKSFRHLPFLLMTTVFAGFDNRTIEKWFSSALIVLLIIFNFIFIEPFQWKKLTAFDLKKEFPVDAVVFMKKNGYTNRIWNEYHYGNYLMFQDIKTSVDGRGDLFALENPVLWEDYFSFTGLKSEKPEEILEKYGIKFVLFPKSFICMKYLKNIDRWKIIYEDDKDVVMGLSDGK